MLITIVAASMLNVTETTVMHNYRKGSTALLRTFLWMTHIATSNFKDSTMFKRLIPCHFLESPDKLAAAGCTGQTPSFNLWNAGLLHGEISTKMCTRCSSRCTLRWISQQFMMIEPDLQIVREDDGPAGPSTKKMMGPFSNPRVIP